MRHGCLESAWTNLVNCDIVGHEQEIAIKLSMGRLRTTRRVEDAAADSGFEELPVRLRHTRRLLDLPLHHRDPFDRILVAQAMEEGLTLVTKDAAIAAYDVRLMAW